MPSTNNSLEASNRYLKENITNYIKLPLGEFMQKFLREITAIS